MAKIMEPNPIKWAEEQMDYMHDEVWEDWLKQDNEYAIGD